MALARTGLDHVVANGETALALHVPHPAAAQAVVPLFKQLLHLRPEIRGKQGDRIVGDQANT